MKRYYALALISLGLFVFVANSVLATTIKIKPDFDKYEKPEGPNPINPDHTKSFVLKVTVTGIPTNEYCSIDVKLENVTDWKGTCANYPQIKPQKDRDLKFLKNDNIDWKFENDRHLSYKTTTSKAEPTVIKTVNVRSYDYGAYGNLVVTVKKRGWILYREQLATPKSQSIPIDKNENRIADGWENDDQQSYILPSGIGGYNPSADDENVLNINHGDSFIVFEEYRGVWLNKSDKHKRLKPSEKEVVIAPQDEDGSEKRNTPYDMWYYGKGRSDALNGHKFYRMHPNYVKDPFKNVLKTNRSGTVIGYHAKPNKNYGWININSTEISGSKRVYAVRVEKNRSLAVGSAGIAPATPNVPSPQTVVYIYYNRIKNVYPNQSDLNTMLEAVMGHEVGHCINLDHCNVAYSPQNDCMMQKAFANIGDASDPVRAHHNDAYDVASPAGATIPPYHDPKNPRTSQR